MINNNSLKITKNTIKVIFDIKDYISRLDIILREIESKLR